MIRKIKQEAFVGPDIHNFSFACGEKNVYFNFFQNYVPHNLIKNEEIENAKVV